MCIRDRLKAVPDASAGRPRREGREKQRDSPTTAQLVRRITPGPEGRVEVYRRPRDGADAQAVAIGDLAELIWDPRPLRVAMGLSDACNWQLKTPDYPPTTSPLLTHTGPPLPSTMQPRLRHCRNYSEITVPPLLRPKGSQDMPLEPQGR